MDFNAQFFIRLALGLVPVLIFLATLMALDNFKLIRARAILLTLGMGGLVALLCLFANSFILQWSGWEMRWYARYGSPGLEEFGKALYLQSLRKTFPSEIMLDILCYLRLHLELSIKAKGLMLMREAGFTPAPDPEINETLAELAYLKSSIGKTGMLALAPFVSIKSQDLWQLHMLKK